MSRLSIEDVIRVVRRELSVPAAPPRAPEMDDGDAGGESADSAALRHLDALWRLRNCKERGEGRSHRRVLGTPVRVAKRAFRLLFQPFINETLDRQARFNDHAVGALEEMRRSALELSSRLDDERRERAALAEEARALRAALAETTAEPPFDYARFHEETSEEEKTRELYRPYVDRFRGCSRVADLGCGRGTFLSLLREGGISAYGVERNHDLAARCRAEGFDVREEEILAHLERLSDGALDGAFLGHVVEHLDLIRLVRLLRLLHVRLRPGGVLLFETPNTENLVVLGASYFRDPTHQMPRHPETYLFLVRSHGFTEAELLRGLPTPAEHKLRDVPSDGGASLAAAETINWNTRKLNEILYGWSNVAIACRNGGPPA